MAKIHEQIRESMNRANTAVINDRLFEARQEFVDCVGAIDKCLGGDTKLPDAPSSGDPPPFREKLARLTKEGLSDYANEHDVDLPAGGTKADFVEAIGKVFDETDDQDSWADPTDG